MSSSMQSQGIYQMLLQALQGNHNGFQTPGGGFAAPSVMPYSGATAGASPIQMPQGTMPPNATGTPQGLAGVFQSMQNNPQMLAALKAQMGGGPQQQGGMAGMNPNMQNPNQQTPNPNAQGTWGMTQPGQQPMPQSQMGPMQQQQIPPNILQMIQRMFGGGNGQ